MAGAMGRAKGELRAAGLAVEQMRAAKTFGDFEISWQNFLTTVEKLWTKLLKAVRDEKGFQQWHMPYTSQRKTDPLLLYIAHARDVDQHTIEELLGVRPGPVEYRNLTFGPGSLSIMSNGDIHHDGRTSISGTVIRHPPRVALLPVTNRGIVYPVPSTHLGTPCNREPLAVAEAALAFYARMVTDAEARFS